MSCALEALPGWLFVVSGMAILGAAVLMPAWTANEHLRWQREVLRQQAERIDAQRQRYTEFHAALVAEDPLLLERLAYSQLHYRPADGEPWNGGSPVTWASNGTSSLSDDRLAASSSIDAALAIPAENVRPVPPSSAQTTRLVRLASGFSRIALLGVAFLFVLGGLGLEGKSE